MANLKSTRDGFGEGLIEGGSNPNILVLGLDLSKATKTDGFAKVYPDRFFECGIQEANGLGVAAGLASKGYRPFISSFGSFLTGRYDQIRCSISMPRHQVILVGTHAGLSPSLDGPTQSAFEDVALMRALPDMTIYSPATATEAKEVTKYLCNPDTILYGPVYLRLGRHPVIDFAYDSSMGYKAFRHSFRRTNNAIVSTGCLLTEALAAGKANDYDVFHVGRIKPINPMLISELTHYKKVFTVEDHSINGGLGSLLCEELSGYSFVERIGINDTYFPDSGNPMDLYKKFGLTTEGIIKRCL